jgi:hypothetical protein
VPPFALCALNYEARVSASTTPVPLFTLFALKTVLYLKAMNSNNVKGGTMLAKARSAQPL